MRKRELRDRDIADVSVSVENRTRQRLPPAFFQRAARETLGVLRVRRAYVVIALIGERRMTIAAKRFLGKPRPTNVLAFPYVSHRRDILAGDILICVPVARREARDFGRTLRVHLALLAVHGMVHVAGYAHRVSAQAKRMEAIERRIARRLQLSR